MKYFMVVSLACLLSACVSNAANLPQTHADTVAEFPAGATDLSACVHQATEALEVPYNFRLHTHPDKRKISITAASVSKVITRREMIGLELHFIPQGQSTTVEMRKGVTGGWWLAPKVWPLVEHCSQQQAAQRVGNPRVP
jgi:rhamnose utilization protein RhaD (predicted bifunctional aldolase and dehydrogenase)